MTNATPSRPRMARLAGAVRAGVLGAFLAAAGPAAPSLAQGWPERPVTIIVPSAPGDGSDIAARLIGEKLRAALGQPFVVENRLGAGGVIGSAAAAKAAPDGYTLVMANAGSHGINPATYVAIPYDAVRDFTPISLIYRAPNIFVADVLPVFSSGHCVSFPVL